MRAFKCNFCPRPDSRPYSGTSSSALYHAPRADAAHMVPLLTSTSTLATFWETLGAVAIAVMMGLMLYGLTLHQVYRYFEMYPDDPPCLKTFVAALLALETWHTILWLVAGYHYLFQVRFTSISLVEGHWSVRLSILATALTVAATEGFYAWRAYLLGSTCLARYLKWLVIPTVVLLLVCKGFALAAGIEAFSETRTIAGFQHLSWLVAASYGLASATDVTMAVTMVFLLRRTRIGLRRSDTLLDVLIKYTISTGILTSVCSMFAFIFAIVLPGNLIYAGFSIVGTKLYANSVLAFLNSRVSLRRRLDGFVDTTSFIDLSPLPQDVLLQDQHRDGSNADGPSVTDGCAPRVSSCSCDTCQTSLCFHASD